MGPRSSGTAPDMSALTLTPPTSVEVAEVTVAGIGFARRRTVYLSIDGRSEQTFRSGRTGKFTRVIRAPIGAGGHTVSARDTLGNTAQATLTVTVIVAPPPAPPSSPVRRIEAPVATGSVPAAVVARLGRPSVEVATRKSSVAAVLAAALLAGLLVASMALRVQPLVLASSAAILATALVAPYVGLLVSALLANLRPPDGLPPPGLQILLAGAILLGWVYRLPIDRPRLRLTLPLALFGGFELYTFAQQLPELAGGYSGDVGHLVGYQFYQVSGGFGLMLAAALVLPGRDPRPVVAAVLGSAVLAAMLAIASEVTVTLPPLLVGLVAANDFGIRAVGSFSNPNYFGFAGALATTTALAWASITESPRMRAALLLAAGICAGALVLTLSRGGIVTLLAGLSVLAFVRFRYRGVLAMMAILIAFGLVYPFLANYRLGSTGDSPSAEALAVQEQSDRERAAAVLAGPQIWATSPVFGVGFGHYSFVSARFSGNLGATAAHNWYVNVLAEEGLVGALLWLLALLAVALALRRRPAEPRILGLSVLLAFAVGSLFLEPPDSFQSSALPILVITAALAATWESGPRGDAPPVAEVAT
jgi:O-antigen ligase